MQTLSAAADSRLFGYGLTLSSAGMAIPRAQMETGARRHPFHQVNPRFAER